MMDDVVSIPIGRFLTLKKYGEMYFLDDEESLDSLVIGEQDELDKIIDDLIKLKRAGG